jgi:hypothetical protein
VTPASFVALRIATRSRHVNCPEHKPSATYLSCSWLGPTTRRSTHILGLYGYSTSAANVATPFGLFPSLSAFEKLPGLLVSGTEQGIQNFIGDFTGSGPNPVTLSSLS